MKKLLFACIVLLIGINQSQAFWQSRDSNYDKSAGGIPVVTYIAENGSTSGSGTTTITWSSVNIGTAFSTRRIIIAQPAATSGLTLVSCTIAGISCDVVNNQSTGATLIAFASANIGNTGGSSTTVVLVYSNSNFNAISLWVWSVDNSLLSSATPVVGSNVDTANTTNSATTTASANGFVISVFTATAAAGAVSINSSTAGITQDGSTVSNAAVGHANGTGSGSSSITWNSGNSVVSNVAIAAWR